MEVSIILPCLNEARTIGSCVSKAHMTLAINQISGEIIVADNGSNDESREIACSLGATVIKVQEKGYGAALMGGIAAAQGKYIIIGDADDSYDFSAILPFILKLREGYDLVMGCRFPKGGGTIMPGAMPWKHRFIGTPILSAIGRLFFKTPITDFNCGLRGFRLEAYNKLNMRCAGMEFASEMIAKFSLYHMRIVEVPITLYKDGRDRRPHLRSWRDGWRHLRFMLLYSPQWLFLFPGLICIILGLPITIILSFGSLKLNGVELSMNSLLVSAMVLLAGLQLVFFAFFTKIYAISEKMLPEDSCLKNLRKYFSLEMGLLVGFFLFLIGLILLFTAIWHWKAHAFGVLPFESLRITILGTIMLIIGLQIIFSSFFLSILGLKHKL